MKLKSFVVGSVFIAVIVLSISGCTDLFGAIGDPSSRMDTDGPDTLTDDGSVGEVNFLDFLGAPGTWVAIAKGSSDEAVHEWESYFNGEFILNFQNAQGIASRISAEYLSVWPGDGDGGYYFEGQLIGNALTPINPADLPYTETLQFIPDPVNDTVRVGTEENAEDMMAIPRFFDRGMSVVAYTYDDEYEYTEGSHQYLDVSQGSLTIHSEGIVASFRVTDDQVTRDMAVLELRYESEWEVQTYMGGNLVGEESGVNIWYQYFFRHYGIIHNTSRRMDSAALRDLFEYVRIGSWEVGPGGDLLFTEATSGDLTFAPAAIPGINGGINDPALRGAWLRDMYDLVM